MIRDLATILWKESKELLPWKGGISSGMKRSLVAVLVMGVVVPLLMPGEIWDITLAPLVMLGMFLPVPTVMGVIVDSFAGERERHTLETLLATRLDDTAILMGKVLAAFNYAMTVTLASTVVSLVTLNLAHAEYGPFLPGPILWLALIVGGSLSGLGMAGVGVLISMRARTVRDAAQILSLAMLVVFMSPMALNLAPEHWKRAIYDLVLGEGLALAAGLPVLAAIGLFVIDVLLLAIALTRFKRDRLVSRR
jgi:ABC-2 type transport system permease protein